MVLCGFEFVEFASLVANTQVPLSEQMGFSLNEKSRKTGYQIEEFLMQCDGEGIQQIALLTDDILIGPHQVVGL